MVASIMMNDMTTAGTTKAGLTRFCCTKREIVDAIVFCEVIFQRVDLFGFFNRISRFFKLSRCEAGFKDDVDVQEERKKRL